MRRLLPQSIPTGSRWLLLLGITLHGPSLHAGSLPGQEEDSSPHSEAWLVPEITSIQPGAPFTVAVRFEMEPGWHNYWRNAGDSGLPTTIEWALPPGFRAGEIQWPYPERIELYPLVDYGYTGEVALLVEIDPPPDLEAGSEVELAARVDWLICERICLPAFAHVAAVVPVAAHHPTPDPRWLQLFAETRARLPRTVDGWHLAAEVVDGGYRLEVESPSPETPLPAPVHFFPADKGVLAHAEAQVRSSSEGGFALDLVASPYASQPTTPLRGVLLAEDGGSWDEEGRIAALLVEVAVDGAPPPMDPLDRGEGQGASDQATSGGVPPGRGTGGGITFPLALVFAFVGGILLNLMPCVFPVLSLKILGAAAHGGNDRRSIRNQGLAFGSGVVLSFLGVAGLLIGLRTGGAQLGWGFQLQSPAFVAAMAALFFAIGLNLMGVFEVGAALTRLGERPGARSGYGEALASGVLATVIATPCTAPFMGAALGFALTRSAPETLFIFGSLGTGMALPYVLLSVAPGLLERLPRPGPWMETMKQLLAFPMFATVIWLAWVYGQQTGVGGTTYLMTALLLIGAAGWMVGRWHRTDRRSGLIARGLSLLALTLAVIAIARGNGGEASGAAVHGEWQPFSPEEVARTLQGGQPAFVDFTAAWCLTCQVNERLVLSTQSVRDAFRSGNVRLFRADWTRQDPVITAALEALGRSGVPVYALYPGRPGSDPHILPAVLTSEIIFRALRELAGPPA